MTRLLGEIAIAQWDRLEGILTHDALGLKDEKARIRLDSKSLDLASIVAVSRFSQLAMQYRSFY